MIQTADVTKLACHFIDNVKLYIKRRKYQITPCVDELYASFKNYKLATSLADCLEHEDECALTNITADLTVAECTPTIKSCDDVLTVTLSKSSSTCNTTVKRQKLNGINSVFPDVVLVNNSIYQQAKINVVVTDCSETQTVTIESGCKELSGGSIQCLDSYKYSQNITYVIDGPQAHSTGYIKKLRVYKTDSSGILDPTPIDLNLAPSNLAAWVACGTCSGISAADLYFGSANWANAFLTLLENVVRTLEGSLLASWLQPSKLSTSIAFGNRIKHNPSGEWYGINDQDFYMEWVDNSNITYTITSPSSTSYTQTKHYFAENFSISTVCGNVTGRVVGDANGAVTSSNIAQLNFNYIGLSTTQISLPVSINDLVIPTCTKTVLTATISSPDDILTMAWYDPEDNFIGEEASISVTESGEYTFAYSTIGGCELSQTITV